VRAQFRRVKQLKEISVAQRGWTLDVLNIVRRIVSEGRAPRDPNFSGQSGTRVTRPSDSFTTADVYVFERELEKLHPDISKAEVKTKTKLTPTVTSATTPQTTRAGIRQQLQELRDRNLLLHVGRNCWRLP
jgi:hypothetical protein